MHNVDVAALRETVSRAEGDPSEARLGVHLEGGWNADDADVQFSGDVAFPMGSVTFTADFPSFLGGKGRAPTPLGCCFYGAMCCYGATFATQAALAGVEISSLAISLDLEVDFRAALGMGDFEPMSDFRFRLEVETNASDEELAAVKQLTNERCPAIWAMKNPVPHHIDVERVR